MSNTQVAWKLWQEWVLACIAGGIGGLLIGGPILVVLYRTSLGTVTGWTVAGIFWGIVQHDLVLRKYLSKTNGNWVLASVVGVLISSAIAEPTIAALERNIGWAGLGAVGAIFQYLVLRQHFLWANRWLLASGVGVAIGMAVGETLARVVEKTVIGQPAGGDSGLSAMARAMDKIVGGIAGLAVGGTVGLAIYGTITGGVLVWLLRHPRVTEHN